MKAETENLHTSIASCFDINHVILNSMTTTDLWQAWNHQTVAALHSGLSELAKDLDYKVPDVSLFRRYGTPHFKTT
eukprot:2223223-Karenia_brevis.AAC.1